MKDYLQKIPDYINWLNTFGNKGTAKKYAEALHQFEAHVKTIPTDPTPEDAILSYVSEKKKSGLSVATINSRISALKSFFEYTGYTINKNKVKHLGEQIEGVRSDKYISYGELKTMLNYCDGENKLMITILLITGARLSEACMIKYDDIKVNDNNTITMTIVTLKQRKYAARRLTISTRWAVDIIIDNVLKNENKKAKLWDGTPECLRQRIYTIAKKAGLKNVHPHSFRHALATHLLNKRGGSAGGVQKILGHKSLQTTGIYSHESEKDMEDTMKLVD